MARVAGTPTLLQTTNSILRTVPSNFQVTFVSLIFKNLTTALTHVPTVFFVPSGGSAGDANEVWGGSGGEPLMDSEETYEWSTFVVLNAGDTIEVKADANNVISCRLSTEEKAV